VGIIQSENNYGHPREGGDPGFDCPSYLFS